MSVVALETDRGQAEAIRHACALAGTTVTIVESGADLSQAIEAHRPGLVLLPWLVTAVDEATLVEFLRTAPQHAHVEVLMTPALSAPRDQSEQRGWLRRTSRRGAGDSNVADETAGFAERIRWSLEIANERHVLSGYRVPATSTAPPSLIRALNDVMENGHELTGLQLSDANRRLLQKLDDDRRLYRRFPVQELQGLRGARIKYGPDVALIDVSAGGALLESESRLYPETEAILELARGEDKIAVPFRVLRSQFTALGGSPRYRGACEFKSLLDLSELLEEAAMIPAALALVPARVQSLNAW
jgi:CheY-like chemotaxis protein